MPSEATERSGRLHSVMIHKSGNLPYCWYRIRYFYIRFRSRGIDRTVFRLSGMAGSVNDAFFPICTIQIYREKVFLFSVHTLSLRKEKFKMETKTNTKKIVTGFVIALVLAVIGIIMGFIYNSTREEAIDGEKAITLQIMSERDSYSFEQEYKTDEQYLGDFLEKEGIIGFDSTEYGRYITSVQGYESSNEDQSWWSIYVNGESAVTGVDEIILEDGSVYLLELKIGW